MPGVNFSFLLVKFSTVCDVISHANKRGVKHFLQPGSYGFASLSPVQILPDDRKD